MRPVTKGFTMPVKLLLSGGIDSAACLAYYASRRSEIEALFVNYGQPQAEQERVAAANVADYFCVRLHQLTIVPSSVGNGYVSGRNGMLVCLALTVFGDGPYLLAIGIHTGTSYADCTPAFEKAMQRVIDVYTGGRVRLDAPFLGWTKDDILSFAHSHDVPFDLTCSSNPEDVPPSFYDVTSSAR